MEEDKEDKKHIPFDEEDVAILETCHHHLQVRQQQKQLQAREEAAELRQVMNVSSGMFQQHSLHQLQPGAVWSPSATELPIERLVRAVKSCSPQALSSAVSDISSVISMVDRIANSAPGNGSRASVGEDFIAMTKCPLQARNFMTQETKKMKKMQIKHALLKEIKEINQRLIDTVVEICDDEDAAADHSEGTTVRFSFLAVSLSPALKAHISSTQMSPLQSPIQPIRVLVPSSYPDSSPFLLDKLPVKTRKEKEDLSSKAFARLNIVLGSLSQPMSLKDIAKTWDACVRGVICEYAQQFGGGTFSSKYGTWEKFVAAS